MPSLQVSISPSVRFEQVLDHGRRVVAPIEIDRVTVDDQRPSRMIGDETIVLEADSVWFSRLRKIPGLPLAGTPEAGGNYHPCSRPSLSGETSAGLLDPVDG
jgi:hypothetical protein